MAAKEATARIKMNRQIPEFTSGVLKVMRLLANNPREVAHEDAMRLYREVL